MEITCPAQYRGGPCGAAGGGCAGAAQLPAPRFGHAQPQAAALPDESAEFALRLRRERDRQEAAPARRGRRWAPMRGQYGHCQPGRRCWCWCWARRAAAATSASMATPATPRRELSAPAWPASATPGPAAPAPPRRCPACSRTWDAKPSRSRAARFGKTWSTCCSTPGLAVLWLDNQPGGCKGVCDRVPNVNVSDSPDPKFCATGECVDGVLLRGLDARLAALPPARRARGVVLVMHQNGSHGPAYSLRSLPGYKRFLPECTSSHLPDCDVDGGAQRLRQLDRLHRPRAGLETIQLAARRAPTTTRRCFTSPTMASRSARTTCTCTGCPMPSRPTSRSACPGSPGCRPPSSSAPAIITACLDAARAETPISHDNLFHTVLGMLQVSTAAYQRSSWTPTPACAAP